MHKQEAPSPKDLDTIMRTDRGLESYQKFFGETIGQPNELILDIGAGDSPFAQEVKDSPDHNATVIRLDLGYESTPPEHTAGAIAADSTRLPFKDGSFDRIVSSWMLPHIERPVAKHVVDEIFRVLKPGGQAMLSPSSVHKSVNTDHARKARFVKAWEGHPTLKVTKSYDYDKWNEDQKDELSKEIARQVTLSGPLYALNRKVMAKSIEWFGSNRTSETGGHTLRNLAKKKLRGL